MRLIAVLTVVGSLATSSIGFAAETLTQSAARIVQQIALTTPAAPAATSVLKKGDSTRAEAAQQGGAPTLQQSGMSKRNTVLIYLGIGVGFVSAAYAIDHNVLDVTPSSQGKRKD